ncbi:MAG: hypothetical protein L6Q76_06275 [Polyangiaceae bacterium]|nr:hypothetical protein [Polyangiaceae bacterium]
MNSYLRFFLAAVPASMGFGVGSARASGAPENLTFRAQKAETDADMGHVTLEGDVEIVFGRARVVSDALRLVRTPGGGAIFDGEARLAFCPCPDPPAAIAFAGGEVFPEGDLTLRFPRLELFGLPVFALPWIWIRAPHQVGIFPPSIAWRGDDGLILGSGMHVPWAGEDGEPRVFQATAAGYLKGGVEVGVAYEGPSSQARAALDWYRDPRVELFARGFRRFDLNPNGNAAGGDSRDEGDFYKAGAAWDVDAIRGDWARARTVDLSAAARPYDSMAAETSLRIGNRAASGFLSTFMTGRAWRGDGRIAGGPGASLSLSGPLSRRGAWDALIMGSVLRDDQMDSAAGLGIGLLGAEMTLRPGPFQVRLSSRERVQAATRGPDASLSAGASAGASIGLPLIRRFGDVDERPGSLVHVIEPSLEAQAAAEHGHTSLFRSQWDAGAHFLWKTAASLATSWENSTGSGASVGLRAGLVGLDRPRAAGRAVAAARTLWFSGDLEAALIPGGSAASYAVLARFRAGPPGGIELRADVAVEGGSEAAAARVFSGDPGAIFFATDRLDYLVTEGLSGSSTLSIPWTRWLRTRASAAADFTAERLLAIGLGVEIEHPCGCISISASGAHRAGREGVDAIVSLGLTPDR